jgi:hypothetical protein
MEQIIDSTKRKDAIYTAAKGVALVAGIYYGAQVLSIGYDHAKMAAVEARKSLTLSLIEYDWDGKEVTFDLKQGKKGRLGESLSREDLERSLFVSLVKYDQCNFAREGAIEMLR